MQEKVPGFIADVINITLDDCLAISPFGTATAEKECRV
jgi:hypothetical protein